MSHLKNEYEPFEHAILTLDLLENHIKHMKRKWKLYNSIGYLPKTNVFDAMLNEIFMCRCQVRTSETFILTNKFKNLAHGATLRESLYYNIENISDIMNAINYGFLNRLTGMVAPDPIVGMEVASKQFGGVQLVHNATESIMKDYIDLQERYLFNADINCRLDLDKKNDPESVKR